MTRSVFLIVSLLVFCSSDCLARGFDEPTLIPYGTVWPEKPVAEEDVQTEVTDDMAERSRRWLIDHLDNLSGGIDSFFVDRFLPALLYLEKLALAHASYRLAGNA